MSDADDPTSPSGGGRPPKAPRKPARSKRPARPPGADESPSPPAPDAASPRAGDPPSQSDQARGADLARDALAAARRTTAERRAAGQAQNGQPARRTGSAAALRRKRWSGSGPDARDPAPLGATLRSWVKQAGAGADLTKATVLGRWAEIVGPEIADHCTPVTLVDGDLLVQAESTAWATQIRMMAGQIMAKINREVGSGSVKRIRAQGPSSPSWRFGPRHVRGRGPRDTYG